MAAQPMSLTSRQTLTARASSRRACRVVASAHQPHQPPRQQQAEPTKVQQLQSAALASAASLVLLIGGGSFAPCAQAAQVAEYDSVAEAALEAREAIEAEQQQIEYMLAQRDVVRRAVIYAGRQEVRTQIGKMQGSLEQRLTKEKANLLAATKLGDNRLAEAIKREEQQLEEQRDKLRNTLGLVETRLARAELLSKARMLSAKKRVAQEAEAAKEDVGSQLLMGGLTSSSMPSMAAVN